VANSSRGARREPSPFSYSLTAPFFSFLDQAAKSFSPFLHTRQNSFTERTPPFCSRLFSVSRSSPPEWSSTPLSLRHWRDGSPPPQCRRLSCPGSFFLFFSNRLTSFPGESSLLRFRDVPPLRERTSFFLFCKRRPYPTLFRLRVQRAIAPRFPQGVVFPSIIFSLLYFALLFSRQKAVLLPRQRFLVLTTSYPPFPFPAWTFLALFFR